MEKLFLAIMILEMSDDMEKWPIITKSFIKLGRSKISQRPIFMMLQENHIQNYFNIHIEIESLTADQFLI